MPTLILVPTKRVKIAEFALDFAKCLPPSLKIPDNPLENPIIVKSTRLGEPEEAIARFDWDDIANQPQINIKDPKWVDDILGAVLLYQSKNKEKSLTIARDYLSAS